MGLLGNCTRLAIGPGAFGSTFALLPGRIDDYEGFEQFISPNLATAVLQMAAKPTGYYNGDSEFMPILTGEMSLYVEGVGTMTTVLFASRSMTVSMTGSGDMAATASLVIAMIAAMTGSGDLTASINGRADTSIAFTGAGDLTADIAALGNMILAASGGGSLAAAIEAVANMAIDIVATGALTVEQIVSGVWSELLPASYSPGTAGYILGNVMNFSTSALNSIADAVLTRNVSNVEATAARTTVAGIVLKLMSRTKLTAIELEIYRTNGATLFGTQARTIGAALQPTSELGVTS